LCLMLLNEVGDMLVNVIGQSRAVTFLEGILHSGRFPKAMVFFGPPGVGKGHAAKQFAFESCLTGDPTQDAQAKLLFDSGTHPELNFYRPEDCYSESELAKRKSLPTWKVGKIREFLEIVREPVIHGARRTIVFEDFDRIPYGQAAIPDAFLKILEDGVDKTTVIFTTTSLDLMPLTLKARMTALRFARLPIAQVKDLLASHAADPHFDLSCRLGRGSVDDTLEFLKPSDEDSLEGHEIRKRAMTLLRLLHMSGSGKILLFLSTMSTDDLVKFVSVVKSLYADLMLLESGIATGLYHQDCVEDLIPIMEGFDGKLAQGLPAIKTLIERINRPGIRLDHQIKAAFVDLKIQTAVNPL